MSKPGEFELIERYFAPLAGEGSFGFLDDAALMHPTPGYSTVITQDAIAENVHFFADDPPALIAQKALRVNLSDLVAKGAEPKAFSLALGLGERWTEDWIREFANGIKQDCEAFALNFTGGDTFSTKGGAIISVTVIGEVPEGQYTSRLDARAGDLVYVSGTIGDGALGLLARARDLSGISMQEANYLKHRYWLPQPRLGCIDLVREFATASMDISDGLIGDCAKLAKASDVQISIDAASVPLSETTARIVDNESLYLETALTGGDDYEILVCIKEKDQVAFEAAAAKCAVPMTRIGSVSTGNGTRVFDKAGNLMKFATASYDHSIHSNSIEGNSN